MRDTTAHTRLLALLAILMTVAALGCVVEGDEGEVNSGPRGDYPAGPYGKAEGAILEDLGFVTPDGGALSLSDIHADESKSLLVILTSSGWCTACIEEQPALEAIHNQYKGRGLALVVTLFEDDQFLPADAALAQEWVERHGVTFPVVADPEFVFEDYYDARQTPMNMIVDLASMKIERIFTGADTSALEAIIEAKL